MSESLVFELWCFLENDISPFTVEVAGNEKIIDLKEHIHMKKERGALRDIDAADLFVYKLREPEPLVPEDGLPERLQLRGSIPTFADKLESSAFVGEVFEKQPETNLHILVTINQSPIFPSQAQFSAQFSEDMIPDSLKRGSLPFPSDGVKRLKTGIDPLDFWLVELHSKIWDRQDLRPKLFHKVEVTVAHYNALQERLQGLYPNRDSADYVAAEDALNAKLEILRSQLISKSPLALPSSQLDHSQDEEFGVNDDGALKDFSGVDEASSFFPASLEYLDLSSLELQKKPKRIPLPLLIRQEYHFLSSVIQPLPKNSGGSVMVSGQPGIGKTAFLHLKIIESLIAGEPFLYQTKGGNVYHVTETVSSITSWSSNEPIVAFFDADHKLRDPKPFLEQESIQIITASSPDGAEQSWLKQGDPLSYVSKLASALWSMKELFLTATFLNPKDLSCARIVESTSYFGNNPRRCFSAARSDSIMVLQKNHLLKSIESVSLKINITSLLANARGPKSVSHSVFALSPVDHLRSLDGAEIRAVSSWALDGLLTIYESRQADAAAEFYISLSGISGAASLRGRVMERQLLKYFDSLPDKHVFKIRSLADSTIHDWEYPGPTKRVNFESRTFTPSLLSASELSGEGVRDTI